MYVSTVKKKNSLFNQILAFVHSDMRKLRGMSEQSHYIIGTVCLNIRVMRHRCEPKDLALPRQQQSICHWLMMVEGATFEQRRNGPPPTVRNGVTPFICLAKLDKQEIQTSASQTYKGE